MIRGSKLDHALASLKRQLEPLNYTFYSALFTHISTALYLVPPEASKQTKKAKRNVYHENNSLWEDMLIGKRFYHGCRLRLEAFFLFEWFPRSPGLFFTEQGRSARQEAQHRIHTIKSGQREIVVYDPYGKQSMLDGGIGNIRLNPISVNAHEWMLMSASGNGCSHQGFPVALPLDLYKNCIDEIREKGTVVRSLMGELKTLPTPLQTLYSGYTGVPKMYLQVEDARKPLHGKSRRLEELEVSVAATFKGEVDGALANYATYATFNPGKRGDLDEKVKWIQDEYVHSYKGTVLTDFDEQENHFPNARFSLSKVMNLTITERDFENLNVTAFNVNKILIDQRKVNQMTNYNISGGNVGAVGDGARAENVTQNDNRATFVMPPLGDLAKELARLRTEALKRATSPEQSASVGDLAAAEVAAKNGDQKTVLERLKSAGSWALSVARDIGTQVVVKVIENQIGLG